MKKTLVLAVFCAAAAAFGAKTPQTFFEDHSGVQLAGFTSPYTEPVVTNISGQTTVVFGDMGEKGTITFTTLPQDSALSVECAAHIKLKKCTGGLVSLKDSLPGVKITAKTLVVSDILNCEEGFAGKIALNSCHGILAGENPKGAKIQLNGMLSGTVAGNVKSISANFFDKAVLKCTTPKALSVKAKLKDGGKIVIVNDIQVKAKNVKVKYGLDKYIKINLETGDLEEIEDIIFSWTDEDKDKYLWLKYVPACPEGFQMGQEEYPSNPEHTVKLTKGFYLGVFPFTRDQYNRIGGSHGTYESPAGNGAYPVNMVSYQDLRGASDWPASGHAVGKGSALDKLSVLVENSTSVYYKFDLPTHAQWEYACRSGHAGEEWNNDQYKEYTDENLRQLGWFASNAASQSHPVGEKEPSDWGFYDMHGSIGEFTLDWRGEITSDEVTDPEGPLTGTYRIIKGGGWGSGMTICRSAQISVLGTTDSMSFYGFRVCLEDEE